MPKAPKLPTKLPEVPHGVLLGAQWGGEMDMPNEDDPAVDDVAPSAAAVYDMPWPNDDGWNPA